MGDPIFRPWRSGGRFPSLALICVENRRKSQLTERHVVLHSDVRGPTTRAMMGNGLHQLVGVISALTGVSFTIPDSEMKVIQG